MRPKSAKSAQAARSARKGSSRPPARKPSRSPSRTDATAQRVTAFPAAWGWWADELLPSFVKQTYSPRESWKDKPFTKEDAHFFFRGIEELSSLFTEERPAHLPSYFNHPKFRSAYLLYFLPLQAAKFLTLFELHAKAFDAAWEHGLKSGTLRIVDLGAGPGTASLAALLRLMKSASAASAREIPPIELIWVDTNRSVLEDGKALVERLSSQFPKLRGKVTVRTQVGAWWDSIAAMPEETSLVLFGNVLNEASLPQSLVQKKGSAAGQFWPELFKRAKGGGVLLVEPAIRRSSQLLTKLRDELFETEVLDRSPARVWGPCLHAGNCPLADGRDWCHFSVPTEIPGKWFAAFSKGLGSERHWLKFSYLWLASESAKAPVPASQLRRVVSDPLRQGQEYDTVLICEPEVPGRISIPVRRRVRRGDIVTAE